MNISVVIPTYNRKNELRRAVQSINNQTVLPGEVIIVDDGSKDPVKKDRLGNIDDSLNLKILRNQKSKGANNARNRGVREANGEWIAFLDDDDEFFPDKIEKVSRAIERCCKITDLFYHSAKIQMVNEGVSYTTKPTVFKKEENVFKSLLVKNHIGGTPMVIVKKSKLEESGLFAEEMSSLQDYELWIRLAKNNAKFNYIDSALTKCNYITENNSVSKSLNTNIESLRYIERKYRKYYKTLSSNQMKSHKVWITDMQIHKAYLNKCYLKAIYLNFKALFKLLEPKYLFGGFAAMLGSSVIFKLRALKS